MAFSPRARVLAAALLLGLCCGTGLPAAAGSRIDEGLEVTWGDGRGSVSPDGQVLTLSLDRTSGSGFRSRDTYLFARADVQLKLVPNNSAGTVTTFYVREPLILIDDAFRVPRSATGWLVSDEPLAVWCSSSRRARGTSTTRWTSSSWAT